jgi:hypothetical protein
MYSRVTPVFGGELRLRHALRLSHVNRRALPLGRSGPLGEHGVLSRLGGLQAENRVVHEREAGPRLIVVQRRAGTFEHGQEHQRRDGDALDAGARRRLLWREV